MSSRSGRTPARERSCRRRKAQSTITSMARKLKAMLTPMAVLTARGTLSFRFRKPTIGSAASASRVPSRKGEIRGSNNRADSHTAANTASTDRLPLIPGLMGTLLSGGKMGVAFSGKYGTIH